MIKEKIHIFKNRTEIPKYLKEIKENNVSNVIQTKTLEKYRFYKCDYCNAEIRLDIKKTERSGGTVILPHTLTKCGNIELVLCNKCIKKAIKEFEE